MQRGFKGFADVLNLSLKVYHFYIFSRCTM